MLRFNLLWIGKTREPWIKKGVDEYLKRLSHYLQVNITEIKDRTTSRKLSKADVMKIEADHIKKALPRGNIYIIALDRKGRQFSSEALAKEITRLETLNYREIVWITGGAYGLDSSILEMADTSISLSELTFTHDMTRVIVAEQLYRACTIRKGEKYHH